MHRKVDIEALPPIKEEYEYVPRLPFKQRLRLYVGGACFIGLGAYIIWKTILILLGLLTVNPAVSPWSGWPQVKYIFVLYDV